MRWKRQQLAPQKKPVAVANLQALVKFAPPALDFAAAVARPGLQIIAEVKRASPDKGLLCRDFRAQELAVTFADAGAAAITCVTDARFFQGNLEHLTIIKQKFADRSIRLPVLRKDFIFDRFQVLESRVAGADAILLIMAVLSEREGRDLLAYSRELGMTAVVEVHTEQELARALQVGSRLISINNRDWRHFTVDAEVSTRLRPLVPPGVLVISDGGIATAEDVSRLQALGFDAAVVGEALIKSAPHIRKQKLQQLLAAGQ